MPRRKAWNGEPPETPEAARRYLVEVARECVDRLGVQKAGLSDVAEAAGVTRQTVYRYFKNTEDLFNSAAALSSGGFLERLRAASMKPDSLAERMVETLVFAITEVPNDPHLGALALAQAGDYFKLAAALRMSFVQEEILRLADGVPPCSREELDEIAELMLRLFHSFLFDPGIPRDKPQLRAFLSRTLLPVLEARIR